MVSKADAALELLNRRKAKASLIEYIKYTDKNYKLSLFSEIVCATIDLFIANVEAGLRPILILAAPPQHGKSQIVSRTLPCYLMGKYPSKKIGAFSYSDDLVQSFAKDVRRKLISQEHLNLFPIDKDVNKHDANIK